MKTDCSIAEDLLPLYKESLLQEATNKWLEEHLAKCDSCSKLHQRSQKPIVHENPASPVNYEKMMSRINLKLSLYQLILLGISFFLAIRTVVLEENFEFILYYTILGLVAYLFYKNFKIVTLIAFLPVFIWHFGTMIPELANYTENALNNPLNGIFDISMVSFMAGFIHLLFALIGALIGYFILKLTESESEETK